MECGRSFWLVLAASLLLLGAAPAGLGTQRGGRPSLDEALANLRVPPDWYAGTPVTCDMSNSWKLGRLEIRRILGLGDSESRHQAIKMTCLYKEKGDIGDGSEYPMYIFLGGEFAWAVREYRTFLKHLLDTGKPGFPHAALKLASCYRHFGEYDQGIAIVEESIRRAPVPPWDIPHTAHAHDMLGDLYADRGEFDQARRHYEQAAQLFPASRQPYGRQTLPVRAAKSRAKSRMLSLPSFSELSLPDGTYSGQSEGYVGPLTVRLRVRNGRVATIDVVHKENIPLGSETIIPRRIIAAQSLSVDAVTAATTTGDAIRHGCLEALRQAGVQ